MNAPKTTTSPSINPAFLPLSIARMLWKRKVVILTTWIVLSAVGLFAVHQMQSVYTAQALILVDSQKIPERFVAATVSTELQDRIATISQQILSSTQLKKIIDDFDLYHQARKTKFEEEILEMMRRDITIDLDTSGFSQNHPGAFRVGYQGPNPAVVAQVANRLANLFIEENLKSREVQAEGTSEFIDNQLQEAKKQLDEQEAAVSKFKLAHNGELPEQEGALQATLNRLQAELESNRDAANRAQEQKLVLANSISTEQATAALLTRTASLPNSGGAAERPAVLTGAIPRPPTPLEAAEAQLRQLRTRYSDTYPDVRRLESEIARMKAQQGNSLASAAGVPAPTEESGAEQKNAPAPPKPADEKAGVSGAKAEGGKSPGSRTVTVVGPDFLATRERISTLQAQMAQADKELEFRKAEQQRILKQITDYQHRIETLPVREQEMAQITRDYEISKTNYQNLLNKKLSAEMATDMERRQKSERFTLLDPAQVPQKPAKPRRGFLSLASAAGALGIGLLLGFGLEFKKGALLGEWELSSAAVVLARLPHIEIFAESELEQRRRNRKLRVALWSGAAVSVLLTIMVSIYFVSNRY